MEPRAATRLQSNLVALALGRTGCGSTHELRLRPRALPRAARRGGGGRLPVRALRRGAAAGRPPAPPRRRPVARGGGRAREARARAGRAGDVLPDDGERLLQPRLSARARHAERAARPRPCGRAARRVSARGARRALRRRRRLAQPRPRVRERAGRRARERHGAAVVHAGKVPLRLEPALAGRLPARRAPRGRVRMAAAARPPGDLGLPGRDDGRVDARDGGREAGRALRLPRQRPHRPLVTTVLLSAAGAPGSARLIRALHENGERAVRIVGTDMNENAIGRFLCDAFHRVPPGSDPAYADTILELVERERVDVVLPQSSFDLQALAETRERFPVPVLVSSPDTVHRSNDKAESYALLQRIGVPTIQFRRVAGAREVEAAARELGYPDRAVCFKPVFSSGSRGFRILDPTVDRAHQLLHERPGSVAMRLEEALELLPADGGTELLVMELATGGERTIDGFGDGSEIVLGHPKTREAMRAGLAMYFVTLDDPELMRLSNLIVAELGIEHFFNIQLVGEHVIEINPRISTIVYQDDLNIPYLGVKRALGEISDEELRAYASRA